MNYISKNLKYLRNKSGFTAAKTADILNIGLSTYRSWENRGITPPLSKLKELSDFFEVSVDYLIRRDLLSFGNDEDVSANYNEVQNKL